MLGVTEENRFVTGRELFEGFPGIPGGTEHTKDRAAASGHKGGLCPLGFQIRTTFRDLGTQGFRNRLKQIADTGA